MPEREHPAAVSFSSEAPSSEPASFAAELVRAGRLADADARETARANIFAAWAEADPQAAFLHLRAHGIGEADRHREDIVFRRWAGRDFGAAFDYADRLPFGKSREETFGWLALVVAESDPAEAAVMAGRDMQPGPERTEASIAILHRWSRVDLAAAAVWADTLPAGPFRDRALDEVAGFLKDVPPARSPD